MAASKKRNNVEEKEIRYCEFESDDIEFRDDTMSISGYGMLFDKESVLLGGENGFKEIITRDAMNGVDLSDVYLLSQHNSDDVLGNSKSGTLNLSLTSRGLYFSAQLPDTTLGKDTYTLVKRGDLKSMSFGFTVKEDTWNLKTKPEVRTVNRIGKLQELSLVTHPAYAESSVSVRSETFLGECKECRQKDGRNTELREEAERILSTIK